MSHAWKQTIHINEDIAAKLLKQQHHLEVDSILHLDSGWDNVVYLVNQNLIFRFPRREFGLACMHNEIALLPIIKAHVSFPLSAPDWIGTSSDLYPHAYAGYKMLPGIALCDAFDALIDDAQFAMILAGWIKALHSIPVNSEYMDLVEGEYEWKVDVSHRTAGCKNNLERYESYFLQAGFTKEALLEVITHLERLHFAPVKQAFVHGDLYSRHIMVDSNTHLPSGLIDWGDLHIGHPGIDLAAGMVLTDSALDVFLKTYGDIDQETQRIMTFHAFCHGMSFLPYAFEQNKASLKRWATLVLENAMKRILAQND